MGAHLEVITPSGEILLVPLDASRGATSIGSAAGNDLVLAQPGIPAQAARIDHSLAPYSVTALSNNGVVRVNRRQLNVGESAPLQAWDGLEIGSAVLILADDGAGTAPAAAPVAPATAAATAAVVGAAAGVAAAAGAAGASSSSTALVPAATAAAAAAQAVVYQPLPGNGPIERIKHDYVPLRLDVPVRMVAAGQPAVWQLTVTNGSTNVARCLVSVVGDLYASWIAISDSEFTLLERQSQTISITLLPPRHPASSAGEHHFAIEVRLQDVEVFLAREPASLVIEPFYDYSMSALNPPDRTLSYSQRSADFVFTLENRGNSEMRYRVSGSDGEKATRVEFLEERPGGVFIPHLGEFEVAVPPQLDPLMNTPVVMRVSPLKRKLIASITRTYAVQATVTPVVGATMPNTRQAMIRHKPLTGRWVIFAGILLAAIVTMLLLRPGVRDLTLEYVDPNGTQHAVPLTARGGLANRLGALLGRGEGAALPEGVALPEGAANLLAAPDANSIQVRDGEQVTLRWVTRNGGRLDVIQEAPVGEPLLEETDPVRIRDGSLLFPPVPYLLDEVESAGASQYEVRLSNFMARVPVINFLGSVAQPFRIEVVPANAPIIRQFEVSNATPNLGSSVVLTWNAELPNVGDGLVLVTTSGDRSEEQLLPEAVGTLVVAPEADTTFRLAASSSLWVGGTPAPSRNVDIAVVPPTPTPVPAPLIRQFDLEPLTLLQGGSITVTYNISGSDRRALLLPGLSPARIDLETEVGRRFVQVPVAGQVDVILEAVALPTGFEDVADPLEAPARAYATAIASRIALVPTATPTSTPPPTPTATPREPVIEVLTISPVEIVLGNTTQVSLTWSVIGDADTISIEAPNFTFTSTRLKDTITVPGDTGRTYVLTALRDGEARASKSVELKAIPPTPTATPEPPPTATPIPPTPTPTATAVPDPLIVTFTALGTTDDPVRREPGENGVDNYFVTAGIDVRIAWDVTGATVADLKESSPFGNASFLERLPKDEIIVTASADNVRYTLEAYNNPNNISPRLPDENTRLYGFVTRSLIIRLEEPEEFAPPTNITFSGGNAADDPVLISWDYNAEQADKILGFRIYKAAAGSTSFARIADESVLNNTIRTYQDAEPPLCGRIYYIVAVYENLLLPGADKTVETDAGDTSFLTPPCP